MAFFQGVLGFAKIIRNILQLKISIIAVDREHFLKDFFKADILTLGFCDSELQKILEGPGLNFDQMRHFADLRNFTEAVTLAVLFHGL